MTEQDLGAALSLRLDRSPDLADAAPFARSVEARLRRRSVARRCWLATAGLAGAAMAGHALGTSLPALASVASAIAADGVDIVARLLLPIHPASPLLAMPLILFAVAAVALDPLADR